MKNSISIWSVTILITILAAGCCDHNTEEPSVLSNEIGSTLRTEGNYKISGFALPVTQLSLPDGGRFGLLMTSQTDGTDYRYDGNISKADTQNYLCEIMIPIDAHIPDGDYNMKFITAENKFLNTQLSVTVRSEMVSRLVKSTFIYGIFAQKGTPDDPFRVTTGIFHDFLNLLQEDPAHAEGLCFLQTENIIANRQGGNAKSIGIGIACFAGTYDGGGHKLEFFHSGTGSSADNALGLFRELKDKAIVKNLILQGGLAQVADTIGYVAAFSTGNITLDNITVEGSISGAGSRIGGLLGVAKDGTVTVRSYTPEITITASGNEVGGLVGRVENTVVTITDMYNRENSLFMPIEGKEYVGGAIGYLEGSFTFSDVGFSHPADPQDQSLKIIQGTRYTGGLIGKAEIDADCSLSGVTVAMPVYGNDYTGGFIGELTKRDNAGLNIDFCTVEQSGEVISGHDCVGGFIGSIQCDFVAFNSHSTHNSLCGIPVKGLRQVGGIFGLCRTERLTFNAGLKIEGDISGDVSIGGFAGFLTCNATVQLDENLKFNSTMNVSGQEDIGGFAGWVEKTEIVGNTVVTPNPDIGMNLSQTNSVYPGKINSPADYSGSFNSGGIIGYGSQVTLERLYATGSVSGQQYVGGIAGRLESSSVVSCASGGTLKGNYSGGIVGYLSDSQVTRSANYSDIIGNAFYCGGITAYMAGTVTIDKCANFGIVKGDLNLGGIAGYGDDNAQIITDCGNFGAVVSNASPFEDEGIGGIMGKNTAQCVIRGCANHATISVSRGDQNLHIGVGGIAGYLGKGGTSLGGILVERCCNTGTIETTAGQKYRNRLGGIVGYMHDGNIEHNNTVTNCYNRGAVSGESRDNNGGIIGTSNNYTAATSSINVGHVEYGNGGVGYYDQPTGVKTEGLYIEEGSGKNGNSTEFASSDKSLKSTFPKLDFNTIWDVDGTRNDGYPFLQECYFQFTAIPQQ